MQARFTPVATRWAIRRSRSRAEDELMATAAIEGVADWHVFYAYRDVKDGDGHYVVLADGQYPTAEQAAHIARHSPARILRQCEAARALIAEFLRLRHSAICQVVPSRSPPCNSSRQCTPTSLTLTRPGPDPLLRLSESGVAKRH
jgi:Family of unknown function (DUF6221)